MATPENTNIPKVGDYHYGVGISTNSIKISIFKVSEVRIWEDSYSFDAVFLNREDRGDYIFFSKWNKDIYQAIEQCEQIIKENKEWTKEDDNVHDLILKGLEK